MWEVKSKNKFDSSKLKLFYKYNPGTEEKAAQILKTVEGMKIGAAIELLEVCEYALRKHSESLEYSYKEPVGSDSKTA